MSSIPTPGPPDKASQFVAAYRGTWVEWLIDRIARFPGPAWCYYLGAALVFVALGTGLSWMDGTIEFGVFDGVRVINDLYVVYLIAAIAYLRVKAQASLAGFRPALGDLDPQYERLRYELATMRRPMVLAASLIGAAFTSLGILTDPMTYGITPESSVISVVFFVAEGVAIGVFLGVFIFFALRQLSIVVRIHAQSTAISVFEVATHSAFSRLTLRASIALALPIYLLIFLQYLTGGPATVSVPDLIAVVVALTGAVSLFVVPLVGMQRRLRQAKSRLLSESGRRFEATLHKVHQVTDAGDIADVPALNSVLAALITERDTLRKISTWPWETDTLRSFITSIALPILLWLATTLLGRFLAL